MRAIRLANSVVDAVLLVAVLFLLAIGCYALWDSDQVSRAADATQYQIFKPSDEIGELSFQELQAINPEVFAWLSVYGTNIDYPVVHSDDDFKYVNTNAKGEYSLSGAIFLSSGCSKDFADFSSIINGHHMEKKRMFGEIGLFSEKKYFDDRRYGNLFYQGREHGIQFFAFLHADAYNYAVFRTKIEGEEAQQDYLDLLLSLATHTREVKVSAGDRIVLLATCSSASTNGRDILVGKITDEVYENTFLDDASNSRNGVDALSGLWTQSPFWVKMVAIAIPLFFLVVLFFALRKKRSRLKGSPPKDNEQE